MRHEIDAIFENGAFRPLEPLHLPSSERVKITFEIAADDAWLDYDAIHWAKLEGDPSIPLDEIRQRLSKLSTSLADQVIAERGEY